MKDTIAAIATPRIPGGLGIIRVSGKDALAGVDAYFRGISKKPLQSYGGYRGAYGAFCDGNGEKIDEVICFVFRGPKSYTGEDVVEISCHGGVYVMEKILDTLCSQETQREPEKMEPPERTGLRAGEGWEIPASGLESIGSKPRTEPETVGRGKSKVRICLAQPGEFTKRAFLNGKMDLTQAESVMQLIYAGGEQAAKEAVAAGDGALSKRLAGMKDRLKVLLAHLTAWVDFPEEDVPELQPDDLLKEIEGILDALRALIRSYDTGAIYREGVSTVIVGKTNAGKSTLMNLLAGKERSIVTRIPGTTRDVVEDMIRIEGLPLQLSDTAGIRETLDPVERIGVSRSWQHLDRAQLVLAVFDLSLPLDENDRLLLRRLNPENTIAVMNKSDLPSVIEEEEIRKQVTAMVYISAEQGEGLAALIQAIHSIVETKPFDPTAGTLYTMRQKQTAIESENCLKEAFSALQDGMTLDAVMICLEEALKFLYQMTGESITEEIINQVFDQFCVGK